MALLAYSESWSKRDPVSGKREEGRKDRQLMRIDIRDGPQACVHSHTSKSINSLYQQTRGNQNGGLRTGANSRWQRVGISPPSRDCLSSAASWFCITTVRMLVDEDLSRAVLIPAKVVFHGLAAWAIAALTSADRHLEEGSLSLCWSRIVHSI